jgi:hypothetical protein
MNIKIKKHDRRILSLFRNWEQKLAMRQVQKEDDFNVSELVFCKTKTIFWPAKILYKWKKSNNEYLYQVVFYGSFKR